MKPIEFEVKKTIRNTALVVSEKTLDVATWNSFNGYGLLPGIENAEYLVRTDETVGSRIRVKNSDGTGHIEEILEWDPGQKIVMKIDGFPSTLSYIATHFIEEWGFDQTAENETLVTRRFSLFPTNFLARPVLQQIAGLFKKAVAKHLDGMAEELGKD